MNAELGFFIFGIGFFIFSMHYVISDQKEQYNRRVAEMREFGRVINEPPATTRRRKRR